MSGLSKFTVLLFGAALALLGACVLFSGGVSLPTRQPPLKFHFNGLPLLLLGLSPLAAGLLNLAIALGFVRSEARITQITIGFSILALGLAFVLAPKA